VTIAMPATPRQTAAVLEKLAPLYPDHPLLVDPAQPFQVLVATLLSARTKDPTTNAAMERLWARLGAGPGTGGYVPDPADLLEIPQDELAALIHPVGFYQTKARHLHALCRILLDDFAGEVPRTREELLRLPGVGRKVANLVLNICWDLPAICVDIHVHRICNRLGWVATQTPEQTEHELESLVPKRRWATLNRVLVNHGQQVCQPVSPWCSRCQLAEHCPRIGVGKSR
jgi:endonuclease-3